MAEGAEGKAAVRKKRPWKKIAHRLEIIAKNGSLTPEAVVADAKSTRSPLHDEFEWDDEKASHQYRVWQARKLIAHVRLVVETKSLTISSVAYVRDPKALRSEQGYVSVASMKTDRELAVEAVENEAKRAMAYLQRVRDLAAILDLSDELDAILEQFEGFQKRLGMAA